jgi:hypothetical protein
VRGTTSRYGSCVGSPEDRSADLGITADYVRVLLRQLGERTPDMPDEFAEHLRQLFEPHGAHAESPSLCRPTAGEEPR